MNIEYLFYNLIQVAVGQQNCLSHTPSEAEWNELYQMAKKQSLVGVCFAGVQQLVNQQQEPPEMLYLTWMGMAAKIQQRNETVNRQCVEMQKQLEIDGFSSCILKGQGVGFLYGELRNLRQSGDIDVWIREPFADVMKYVDRIAPTKEVSHQHVHFHVFDDTEVELHFVPSELECFYNNRKLQRYYETYRESGFDGLPRIKANDGEIIVPPTDFNLVFQLSHIYRHLFGEGIGLRQVMDYYFVLKNSTKEDRTTAFEIIGKVGMKRFAGALMWVIERVFGDSNLELLCEADEVTGKVLLDDIIASGNFGSNKERVENDNFLKRTIRFTKQNFHLLRYYPSEVLFDPVWRLCHFVWRKRHGFE